VPLYEYRCGDCQKISSVLVRSVSEDTKDLQPSCDHCQGTDMHRLISKFSFRASWGDSLNWVPSGETSRDVNEDSPASIDSYMGRIKKEMGGQTSPDFNRERRDLKNP
jgi:putative FmdB family regulatory protein